MSRKKSNFIAVMFVIFFGCFFSIMSTEVHGAPADNLLANWRLNEMTWKGTAGEVVDCSGSGNHGTAGPGADTSFLGPVVEDVTISNTATRAGLFDGIDDVITIDNDTSIVTNASGSLTIAAWVKTSSQSGVRVIAAKSNFDKVGTFGLVLSSGRPVFYVNGTTRFAIGPASVATGLWVHLAGVYDSVADTLNIYVDGMPLNPVDNNPTGATVSLNVINDVSDADYDAFAVGGDSGSDKMTSFAGLITDVAVYSAALTASDISSIMNIKPVSITNTLVSAETDDEDNDGSVDGVLLTFTTAVDDTTLVIGDFSFNNAFATVSGLAIDIHSTDTDNSTVPRDGTANDKKVFITFTDGQLDTDVTGQISFAGGNLKDISGILLDSTSSPVNVLDKASPVAKSWTLDFATGNVTVTFNEAINPASLTASGFTIQNTISGPSKEFSLTSISDDNNSTPNILEFTISISALQSTGGLGTGTSDSFLTIKSFALKDSAGNDVNPVINGLELTVSSPTLVSAETDDEDHDGSVDGVLLTFTTDVDDTTLAIGDFSFNNALATVSGLAIDIHSTDTDNSTVPRDGIANDKKVFITFTDGQLDTDVTGQISFASGNLRDINGILLDSTSSLINVLDKASPVAKSWTLDFATGNATVTFNEAINPASLTASGFTIQNTISGPSKEFSLTSISDDNNSTPNILEFTISISALQSTGGLGTGTSDSFLTIKSFALKDSAGNDVNPVVNGLELASLPSSPLRGLLARWRLNEMTWNGSAGEVVDSSGSGNHGTTGPGADTSFSGPVVEDVTINNTATRAGLFDGIDDVITIDNGTSILTNANGSLTIAAWVNTSSQSGLQVIAAKSNIDKAGTFGLASTSGRPVFYVNGTTRFAIGPASVATGQWVHLAGVYDSVADTLNIYVDGMPLNPVDNNPTGATVSLNVINDVNDANYDAFAIGGDSGSDKMKSFDGLIADVAVFSNAQTADDIASIIAGEFGNLELVSAATDDSDSDGFIDGVLLTFNSAIDDDTLEINDFSFGGIIANAAGLAIDKGRDGGENDSVVFISFNDGQTGFGTDLTDQLTYTQGTLKDLSGNLLETTATPINVVDNASPIITGWAFDFATNQLSININESINAGVVNAIGITIQNLPSSPTLTYKLTSIQGDNQSTTDVLEIALSNADIAALAEIAGLATDASNTYLSVASSAFGDSAGNSVVAVNGFSLVIQLLKAETDDADRDGFLDRILLIFSSNIDDSTLNIGHFSFTGAFTTATGLAFDVNTDGTANDSKVFITFDDGQTGLGTGVIDQLSYTAGTLTDLNGIALTSATLNVTDKAAPVANDWIFDFTTNSGEIMFSEAINPTSAFASGFTIQNTASSPSKSFGLTSISGDNVATGNILEFTISSVDVSSLSIIEGLGTDPSDSFLTLVSSAIKDLAENNVIPVTNGLALAPIGPTVSNVSSPSANRTYLFDEQILIAVQFSQTVLVITSGGSPQLKLETDGISGRTSADRDAFYISGSGTDTLIFGYTVDRGDTSNDLDYVDTNALSLNGAVITDTNGINATLFLPNPGASNSLGVNEDLVVLLDDTAPTVLNIKAVSVNGTYAPDDIINLTIKFSEPVLVNTTGGSPKLTLETDGVAGISTGDAEAAMLSGSGSDTLTFFYKVLSGNFTNDLDYASSTALTLEGATITDLSKNNAVLDLVNPGAPGSISVGSEIVIFLVNLSLVSNGSFRENHLARASVNVNGGSIAQLAFSISYDPSQLEFVGDTQSNTDIDNDGLSVESVGNAVNPNADVRLYMDKTNINLTRLIVEVDRGDGEESIIASNGGKILDIVFKLKIGANHPIHLDLAEITALTLSGHFVNSNTEDGSISVDTQQRLLDVDEDGSVSFATDGRYIYRALLYKNLVGLVPIIPTSHRYPNFTSINNNESGLNPNGSIPAEFDIKINDNQIIANVIAVGIMFDVNGDSSVDPGRDGVYIYRSLRGDNLNGTGILTSHGISDATEITINGNVALLSTEAADTVAPRSGVGNLGTSMSSLFGTTEPLEIRFNESVRLVSTGSVLSTANIPAALVSIGGVGGPAIQTVVGESGRIITITPTSNWANGHTVTVSQVLIKDVANNTGIGSVVFQ